MFNEIKLGNKSRRKSNPAWSTQLVFRPMITVDFMTRPALHTLLFTGGGGSINAVVLKALDFYIEHHDLPAKDPQVQEEVALSAIKIRNRKPPLDIAPREVQPPMATTPKISKAPLEESVEKAEKLTEVSQPSFEQQIPQSNSKSTPRSSFLSRALKDAK